MPEVLIRCPVTGKQLATGIALDVDAYVRADLDNRTVWCPFCRQQHVWNKKDSFLRR